jgi:hypothetical protein
MTFSAGPSPTWLGIFAVASFGGLVMAAFASGYHLVGDPQPGSTSSVSVARGATPASEAVVRKDVERARAVLRAKPDGGEVIERLVPEQLVSILAERGDWRQIRYERDGKTREGWTEAVNLSLTER